MSILAGKLSRVLVIGIVGILAVAGLAACGSSSAPTVTPTPTQAQPTAKTPSGATTPTVAQQTNTPTPSFDATSYFSGKTVSIVVPFSPGGGYDLTARVIAPFLTKYLPGHPSMLIKNIPGSGGLRGIEYTVSAKPDGLTVGQIPISRWYARAILGDKQFSIDSVRILGTPSASIVPQLGCVRSAVASSWDAVMHLGQPITVGGTSPGGIEDTFILLQLAGAPVKMVYGYGGTSEILAAVDRGELDATARCGQDFRIFNLYPQWQSNHTLVPLFWAQKESPSDYLAQFGLQSQPPNILDLPGLTYSPQLKSAWTVASTFNTFVRTFFLPIHTNDAVFNAWETAIKQATQDPQFQAKMAAQNLEAGFAGPEQLTAAVQQAKALSGEGLNDFKALVGAQ